MTFQNGVLYITTFAFGARWAFDQSIDFVTRFLALKRLSETGVIPR